jgi:hypothetical protein
MVAERMLDYLGEYAIMSLPAKVSTKPNTQRTGKSTLSYFSVLSHFQSFLGLKMARAARFLRGLVSTLAGLSKNSAGRFYLPAINETSRADACDINQALTDSKRSAFTVANFDSTDIPQEVNFDHLSEAELSALLDLLTSQIEFHRDELIRLKPLLHRLQARIPNNPFLDFINSLD